ncbi:putative TetR family transcriptional regulator [Gordonia araii NBRC 100433]|uniref:Putative TetR family transcriptional regulator n=1 Tax=Gordonia araii NBRC 100433 TaxID=1073574 RepID=G7H3P3_9ACTN|nr:TetR/AcrR family transcriptional regulator [Gordonia araii]NNG96582.1 TetR/AcrR family transcriptional regulator [Gordonia araii NBRC 100433]GAB10468.1 putative TetR family transcriptional regulator [Gordonia araii NBRC 100433]
MRDRKRAETLRRIHDAAVELTKRDGLADATVSAIAERAGVSRRTFFNYFDSKEDAVLGIQPPRIPPEALDAFVDEAVVVLPNDPPGKERFRRALRLTVSTLASLGLPMGEDRALMAVVATHPDLLDRLRAHRDAVQHELVVVLSQRLAEENPTARASDSARAMVLLAGAILRFARGSEPALLDNPDQAAIEAAMKAFREALEGI